MSIFEIITQLELLWLQEDARLEARCNELKWLIAKSDFDSSLMVAYIGALANRYYFKRYIFEIINYLKMFEDR